MGKSEEQEPKMATYGHHFHQYAEMIGAPNVHSVFEYLLDCYMSNIRTGKDGEFKISVRKISLTRNLHRKTVESSIEVLEKMGLIKCSASLCDIDLDRYVSLVRTFVNLEKDDKAKFREFLQNGDYDSLERIGYSCQIGAGSEAVSMKGGMVQICTTHIMKADEVVQNCTTSNESEKSCTKMYHPDENGTNMYHLLYEVVQKCTTLASQIVKQLGKDKVKETKWYNIVPSDNWSIDESGTFLYHPGGRDSESCTNMYHLDDFLERAESGDLNSDSFDIVLSQLLVHFCITTGTYMYHPDLKSGTYLYHSNNNIIIKKNMLDERSESSNKEEKTEETNLEDKNYENLRLRSKKGLEGNNDDNSQIEEKYSGEGLGKGLGEDNDNVNSQPEEENIEEVEVEEVKEEVEEGFDPAKRAILDNVNVAHLKNVEKNRIKSRTPFFPPNEIEDIIRNIESCLDRPDKLFINRFWDIVFESEIETDEDFKKDDEDGEDEERPVKDIFDDMEGWKVDCYSNVTANYLRQAYDEVQEAFDKGYIETENKKLPVNFKEMLPPESVEIILGFETYRNAGREYYVISAKMIKDITRSLPELVDASSLTREDRSKKKLDDLLYLQKIISMAMYDDEYEKLTPVEKEVYLFMDKFFIIDFDNIDWEPNDETQIITSVNSSSIRPNNLSFFMSKMSCCTESEFIDLTTMGRDDCGNHEISQKRVFYADKIRDLNAMRGFESVVDSFEVDLKPLY